MKKGLPILVAGVLAFGGWASPSIASDIPRDGLDYLKTLAMDELGQLFEQGTANQVPHGNSQGLAIISPDATFMASFAKIFWNGKTFTATSRTEGSLVNNLLFNGVEWIDAKVTIGDVRGTLRTDSSSMKRFMHLDGKAYPFDGKPSIILDYHQSSVSAARGIVDEVRQVLEDQYPALFLGRATLYGKFVIYFGLQFKPEAVDPVATEGVGFTPVQ